MCPFFIKTYRPQFQTEETFVYSSSGVCPARSRSLFPSFELCEGWAKTFAMHGCGEGLPRP